MGNNRNLLLLVGLVVVIGVVFVLANDRRPSLDTSGGFEDMVEGTLSTDEVFAVRFALGDDVEQGFELVQGVSGWVMSSYHEAPANLNKIRTLLGNLEAVHGELRSRNPDVLGAYSLEDSVAYRLTIRNEGGNALVDLLIGKRTGNGCFVRRAGDAAVYSVDHNFLSDFGVWSDERPAPDRNSWLDLVAFKVDRSDVAALEIRGEGAPIVLEKEFVAGQDSTSTALADEQYEWRVTAPRNFLATRSRAEGVLNAAVSLRARDVVTRGDDPEGAGLGEEAWTIVVRTHDAAAHELRFGAERADEEGVVYFRVVGEPLVWSVPAYVRDNLFKSLEDLQAQ